MGACPARGRGWLRSESSFLNKSFGEDNDKNTINNK